MLSLIDTKPSRFMVAHYPRRGWTIVDQDGSKVASYPTMRAADAACTTLNREDAAMVRRAFGGASAERD